MYAHGIQIGTVLQWPVVPIYDIYSPPASHMATPTPGYCDVCLYGCGATAFCYDVVHFQLCFLLADSSLTTLQSSTKSTIVDGFPQSLRSHTIFYYFEDCTMARVIYSRKQQARTGGKRPPGFAPRTSVKRLPGFVQVPHPSQLRGDGEPVGFAGKRPRRIEPEAEEEEEEEEGSSTSNEAGEDDSDVSSEAGPVTTGVVTATARAFFTGFENNISPGMTALSHIVPFGNYKPLDPRDVFYGSSGVITSQSSCKTSSPYSGCYQADT